MLKGHPKGLIVLALANMGERFGYYTMLAILTLFIQAKFGLTSKETSMIYGTFLALVYFLPLLGGFIADKALGYGKTILLGFAVMFGGYLLLAMPTEANSAGKMMMYAALGLIAIGTGCFKGNLQALVGNLYDKPEYSRYRDIAFSIFYMFINIGAFFAPSMANSINNAILAKDQYTYDASIPANYVKLNDKVVDENTYSIQALSKEHKELKTYKDTIAYIKKSAKKDGVIFTADKEKALFNLKAAALHQTKKLSTADYETFLDKKVSLVDKKYIMDKIVYTDIPNVKKTDGYDVNTSIYYQQTEVWSKSYVQNSLSKSYNMAFGVACISLIISFLVFIFFKKTWKGVDKTLAQQLKEAKASGGNTDHIIQLTPQQTKDRIIALLLVFFVVIFFWMSFHQNGLTLTFFARDYVESSVMGANKMFFFLPSLICFIVFAYGIYWSSMGLFGGQKNLKKGLVTMIIGIAGFIACYYIKVSGITDSIKITPQIFQQFNPFFIVLLTPLSVAIFSALNKKEKEPSAPRKIGMGMLIAGVGFVVMIVASLGLPAPSEISGISNVLVSPNWLIGTYFTLTIAELLLSPMGLSFVAKVAPPQLKGMMQGGWLAATAFGNYLVAVMGLLWDELTLPIFWGVLVICCVLSAMFIFSVIKKLDKATAE